LIICSSGEEVAKQLNMTILHTIMLTFVIQISSLVIFASYLIC